MGEVVASGPGEQWIPTRGLSWPLTMALATAGFLVIAGSAAIYFVGVSRGPQLSAPDLLLPIVIIVALGAFILVFPIRSRPSGVRLAASGVTVAYPGRKVSLEWSDLMRVRFVGHDVVVFRALSDTANKSGGAYQVSLAQARAILSDPRCPKVTMTDDQRRLIFGT